MIAIKHAALNLSTPLHWVVLGIGILLILVGLGWLVGNLLAHRAESYGPVVPDVKPRCLIHNRELVWQADYCPDWAPYNECLPECPEHPGYAQESCEEPHLWPV